MKLRTFFGLTSRSVLEQVRTELGPDAMIVANRPTADGVEVSALPANAMNELLGDAPAPRRGADRRAREAAPEPDAADATPPVPAATAAATTVALAAAAAAATEPATTPSTPSAAAQASVTPAIQRDADTVSAPARDPLDSGIGARLMEEVAAMRTLIEEQMSQLAWSESLRRSPLRSRFTRDLLAAGYSPQLAREVTQRLPDDYSRTQAQSWLIGVLTRNLQCIEAADDIVTRGGIYALVGPTGVGKTTTTAKLAARCAVRYGAGKIALITTDTYRVGAQDQLRVYAKILGVAVHTVSDRHDLEQALAAVRGRHMVLIDTVGMGQRDPRVPEQATLLAQPGIQRLLLLNAVAQGETQDEVVAAYGGRERADANGGLAGCILTKIDETAKTGIVLDAVIRHRLPIHYVANGQRVPEDLYAANADYLVRRSLRTTGKATAFTFDDDEFALKLGVAGEAQHA